MASRHRLPPRRTAVRRVEVSPRTLRPRLSCGRAPRLVRRPHSVATCRGRAAGRRARSARGLRAGRGAGEPKARKMGGELRARGTCRGETQTARTRDPRGRSRSRARRPCSALFRPEPDPTAKTRKAGVVAGGWVCKGRSPHSGLQTPWTAVLGGPRRSAPLCMRIISRGRPSSPNGLGKDC